MIIDGSGLIMGRLASHAAEHILRNEQVTIVNCKAVVVNGNPDVVMKKFKSRLNLGGPRWGPFAPRSPAAIMRRAVRGMLPRRKLRGREAYHLIVCHDGLPEGIKQDKLQTIKECQESQFKKTNKNISLGDVCEKIGGYKK